MLWRRANQKAIFSGRRPAFDGLEPTGRAGRVGLPRADVVESAQHAFVVVIGTSNVPMMASRRLRGLRLHRLALNMPGEVRQKTRFTHFLRRTVLDMRARGAHRDQPTEQDLLRRCVMEAIQLQAQKATIGELYFLYGLIRVLDDLLSKPLAIGFSLQNYQTRSV